MKHARTIALLLIAFASLLLIFFSLEPVLTGITASIALYEIAPGFSLSLLVDRLSAFFVLIISVVSFSVAIYSIPYVEHIAGSVRKNMIIFLMGVFILSMVMTVLSGNSFSFIFFWEIMSLSSFFLIMGEYDKEEARKAGIFYFVMTQLSTLLLLAAFIIMYVGSGSSNLSAIANLGQNVGIPVFLVLFTAFCIKAGVVPFHKWLPYAHSASPSNISALMSGVMIKVAIYGIVRFVLLVPQFPQYIGIIIISAGVSSAVLGVIYALKEHDLKRLLAYHSIENIGIILIGLGLYLIFSFYGITEAANISLLASLFHTLNHGIFKSLLFLTAGSVVNSTGTRNIEKMGGLIKPMPHTAFLFLIGAASISALPPFNGFVSELMIFLAFFKFKMISSQFMQVFLVICLALLALTSSLAAACFVKAFGITFLAKPRTRNASDAKEVPALMLLGPSILAALCAILGVFSYRIFAYAGVILPIPDLFFWGSAMLIYALLVWVFVRIFAERGEREGETWGCGILSQDPSMEYTASGFSQPIVRIFKPIFMPKERTEIKYHDEKNTIVSGGKAEIVLIKFFEESIYMPVANAVLRVSNFLSAAQNVIEPDSYILYIFLAAIVLLFISRWI
jgi:formate hydrogenlyase subunit 3/multisubunit Na+/H+ antiporter MnhD subunit